jgi:hypothetical protein
MADARSGTAEAAAASTSLAATGTPVVLGPWRSPDGHRAARVELWPCPTDESLAATAVALGSRGQSIGSTSYERLVIAGGAGPATLVDSQLLNCGGLGAGGLDGRFWSPGGRVFYYTDAREGVPDGLDCGWQPSLWAWDVKTGEISGPYTATADGSRVAQIAKDAGGQAVVEVSDSDLASPRHYRLPAAARPDGLPHWSPDGAWLALLDLPAGCGHAPSAALALRLRDGHWLRQTPPAPDTALIGLYWEVDTPAIRLGTFGGDLRWDLASDTLTVAPRP